MKPIFRTYQSEEDFWRMRQFLRELFILNNRLERSWHVIRLDYARWHTCINCANVLIDDVSFLWEVDGEIVAILIADGAPVEAHFLIHPAWATIELEEEMLAVAEERLCKVNPDGSRRQLLWAAEADVQLQELFEQHGYQKKDWAEHQWRRDLDGPIPDAPLPGGYTVRSLGDGLELLERCYASGLGFHDGDIKTAVENRNDPGWYRNIQTAPLYRRDLDLVAIAPDGAIASFCTIWFDDVTRSACFEPVATVPAHQRRGLGKAVMTEGLRRLQRMGARRAFVGGYSPEANALYRSVMGPEYELSEPWIKEWDK
jgi:GNAT superfamily N-acetyltransferase